MSSVVRKFDEVVRKVDAGGECADRIRLSGNIIRMGSAGAGASGMGPMGMPMCGLGGAPGGAGGSDAKGEAGRRRKVVVPNIPHAEDVTGRVDTNRLSAAAAANRDRSPQPPVDDDPRDSAPIVRRLVTRKPTEPSLARPAPGDSMTSAMRRR